MTHDDKSREALLTTIANLEAQLAKRAEPAYRDQFYLLSKRIAHDVKAPIRQISQLFDILISEAEHGLDPSSLELIEMMKGKVAHLSELVEETRDYSDAFCRPLKMESVDVLEIVDSINSLQNAPVKLTIEDSKSLKPIRADKYLTERLFHNLSKSAKSIEKLLLKSEILLSDKTESSRLRQISATFFLQGLETKEEFDPFEPFVTFRARDETATPGLTFAVIMAICKRQNWSVDLDQFPSNRMTLKINL